MPAHDILLRRFRATGLPGTPGNARGSAEHHVRRLGAVQAQEFEMTLWSLGRRTGLTRSEVLAEFESGAFVRTHALRPTWHFVHRDDLALVRAVSADRVRQTMGTYLRREKLTEEMLSRVAAVVARAAADGPLTRKELGASLSEAGFPFTPFQLGLAILDAELSCVVASGPVRGKQQTYALLDVPAQDLDLPERAELAVRFFTSHGPGRVEDFATWATQTKGEATALVAAGADRLTEVETVDGPLHEGRPAPAVVAGWDSPEVELLNGYDEAIAGIKDKSQLDRAGLYRQRAGTAVGVVTVDGQLTGHWRRRVTTARVDVSVMPLRRLSKAEQSGLADQVELLRQFLGVADAGLSTDP